MKGLCSTHPNPDLWFPDLPVGRPTMSKHIKVINDALVAMAICQECPIRTLCLEQGMREENIEHGIWGGMLAGERIMLAKARNNSTVREQAISFAEGVRAWQSIS